MVFIATRLRSCHWMDLQWFWSENSSYSVGTEVFCCSISINIVLHMMCWLCRWWSSVCSQYVICVVGAGRHWNSNACTERLQSDGESSWFTLQSSQLRITTDGQDWSCVQGTVAGSITTAVIDWLCVCALQIALCLYWSIILFMLTVFLRVMSAITSHIVSAGCLPWWCNDYNVRITISSHHQFEPESFHCHMMTLGQLFTYTLMCPCRHVDYYYCCWRMLSHSLCEESQSQMLCCLEGNIRLSA